MIFYRRIKIKFMRRSVFSIYVIIFCVIFVCKSYLINKKRYNLNCVNLLEWGKNSPEEKRVAVNRFLGFKNFVADLYWIYFLQKDYIGHKLSPEFVFNCADLITCLDPHFNVVYRFAAVGLTFGFKRPDLSNKLLFKAINFSSVNKDDWRILFYIGYNYYFFLKDAKRASHYFELASVQPKSFKATCKSDRLPPPQYLSRLSRKLRLPLDSKN